VLFDKQLMGEELAGATAADPIDLNYP